METSVASRSSNTAESGAGSFEANAHGASEVNVEALRLEGCCGCNERDEPASSVGDVGALAGLSFKAEDLGRSWKF